jgi:hypothetical protein
MHSKAEQSINVNPSINTEVIPLDLEQGEQPEQPEQPIQGQSKNKFGLFSTAFITSLGQAATFSAGAAIRHHPVHKGAITALTGGVIAGAIIGLIGGYLGIKEKGNSLQLALCGALLEWAANLSTLPLGTQVVPFQQDLSISTLIEDQLVGCAAINGPFICALLLLPCCMLSCYYSRLSTEERATFRQLASDNLRNYFSTAALILTIAEATAVEEAPIETTNPEIVESSTDLAANIPSATMI